MSRSFVWSMVLRGTCIQRIRAQTELRGLHPQNLFWIKSNRICHNKIVSSTPLNRVWSSQRHTYSLVIAPEGVCHVFLPSVILIQSNCQRSIMKIYTYLSGRWYPIHYMVIWMTTAVESHVHARTQPIKLCPRLDIILVSSYMWTEEGLRTRCCSCQCNTFIYLQVLPLHPARIQ